MSRLNTYNTHPLIPHDPTYMITNKMVTIHSEDRDIMHFPNANEFEITLPEALDNVQSIRLDQITLPNHFYNISEQLQNNIFPVPILESLCEVTALNTKTKNIIIPDGFYTATELATCLTTAMSALSIAVTFDEITQKMTFESKNPFTFVFGKFGEFHQKNKCISVSEIPCIFFQKRNFTITKSA